MTHHLYTHVRSFQKPTYGRCLLTVVIALLGARARAQDALSEHDVVTRALSRAPLTELIDAQVRLEEGRGRAASAPSNPELSYAREQTFGELGEAEDNLSISQTIDLGNRRGLQGDAGTARARAARIEGEMTRLHVAAGARARFYELLYRQERTRTHTSWIARIEEALAIVARRERSGDAALYDLRRLERERAVATARVETDRAALETARTRLRALLGPTPSSIVVAGALLPNDEPPDLASLRASGRSRADLRALDERIAAAGHESTAAARAWVPDLTLQGGWKGVDHGAQGRSDGFILGASLSLPLWDRARGAARVAASEARAARAQRALLEADLDAEIQGAREVAVRLRRAAIDFRARSAAGSEELVRIAAAGYAGGELGLLELLDAYRCAADDALTSLEMDHAARGARLELDRMIGASRP